MPLIISVIRKNVPALSNELCLPSSHRSLRGKRKPCGGGPAGVAAQMVEDEKAAVAAGFKCLDVTVPAKVVRGRARASAVRDLVEAMVVGMTILPTRKWARWMIPLVVGFENAGIHTCPSSFFAKINALPPRGACLPYWLELAASD